MASTSATISPSNSNLSEMEITKKELFSSVMKGDWPRVVELYATRPSAHTLQITRSRHTALHLAISDGKESVVDHLMRHIEAHNYGQLALRMKDETGCTPLHFAASKGSLVICERIAGVDHTLLREVNDLGETPLFLAVLYGKAEAFHCLNDFLTVNEGYLCCRRKTDGQTILHCAIIWEYFDLAYQIMLRYKELVNRVDVEGLTPLHILATKPSAFKSGSNLGRCGKIIYEWIDVDDELKPEKELQNQTATNEEKKVIKTDPKNYATCINFIELFAKAVRVVTSINCTRGGKKSDLEQPTVNTGQLYPANYATCFEFMKFIYKAYLVVVGLGMHQLGYAKIKKLKEVKKQHMWANKVLDKLLESSTIYDYVNEEPGASSGRSRDTEDHDFLEAINEPLSELTSPDKEVETTKTEEKKEMAILIAAKKGTAEMVEKILRLASDEVDQVKKKVLLLTVATGEEVETTTKTAKKKETTAILIAAKNGIVEIVEKILRLYPVAIHDVDEANKNILLLAVENRRLDVYKLLKERNIIKGIMFRKFDSQWNSELHFAAGLKEDHKSWPIPGAALQMQWEIKWFKYIESSMDRHSNLCTNKANETPADIFTKTHKGLVKSGGEWLMSTSTSCSLVAALIATVAFAASTTVPGGVKEGVGKPTLEKHPAFKLFAVSSLVALSFSVTSLVMFLAILTLRYQEKDFGKDLPRKLLIGLTSLFVSIASMLCAFCAGHFFVLEDDLKYAAYPVYAVTCFPICFFAAAQFPLYLDLVTATFWTPF